MNGRPGSVEERVKEMFGRRENDVFVPASLPAPTRRRVRRRIAINATAAGALSLLLVAGIVVGSRVLDRAFVDPRPADSPITLSPGRSVTVAEGRTETLAWRATVVQMVEGGVETRLLATAASGNALYQIAQVELDLGDLLSHHTYLPVELFGARPASGILWGSVTPDADQIRIDMDEGCSSIVAAEDVTWILVEEQRVGVWATTSCSGTGTLTAFDADGAELASEPIEIQDSNDPSVITLSNLDGQLWVFGRRERFMRLQIDGPRESAVVVSLRSASGTEGSNEIYLRPGELQASLGGIAWSPDGRRGMHFIYGSVPLGAAHVSIALADGLTFDASIVGNRGEGFQVFLAEVPDGLEGATVVAFDGSCAEIDRVTFPGEPPTPPVTPSFTCAP